MDDTKFFAWLDGELDAAEAAKVEALVAADAALARRAENHRALHARLQRAFDPIAEAPVPASIALAQAGPERPIDLAEARQRRQSRTISAPAQWAAMAATLAIGIVTGTMIGGGDGQGPIVSEAGRLVAAGNLEQALYTRLASAPAGDGPRMVLTFRDADGDICRTFIDGGSSGLACREGGDWRIQGLFQDLASGQGDYRMASGSDPRLAVLVGETISGEPFDADAERLAQERGWR